MHCTARGGARRGVARHGVSRSALALLLARERTGCISSFAERRSESTASPSESGVLYPARTDLAGGVAAADAAVAVAIAAAAAVAAVAAVTVAVAVAAGGGAASWREGLRPSRVVGSTLRCVQSKSILLKTLRAERGGARVWGAQASGGA
eukprot:5039983-Prymnesium_polylepis.1